ncbi:MAG: aryl-sulfate sulfotransferase [Alphaproteobacteria bacterium]|nr:MAG: aryl-sulfate sulfotransferase [Alphaproteobacteria bacterium]
MPDPAGELVPTLDPASCRIAKRSVMIAGHKTSVSLEAAFWERLRQASWSLGVSINELVTLIDSRRSGNLSSAIRVYLLQHTDRPQP